MLHTNLEHTHTHILHICTRVVCCCCWCCSCLISWSCWCSGWWWWWWRLWRRRAWCVHIFKTLAWGFAAGTAPVARTVPAALPRAALQVAPQNAKHDATCEAFDAITIVWWSYTRRTPLLLQLRLPVGLVDFSVYAIHHMDGSIPLSVVLSKTLV